MCVCECECGYECVGAAPMSLKWIVTALGARIERIYGKIVRSYTSTYLNVLFLHLVCMLRLIRIRTLNISMLNMVYIESLYKFKLTNKLTMIKHSSFARHSKLFSPVLSISADFRSR